MAGKWLLYPIVCCVATFVLPMTEPVEVRKTCVDTCLRLIAPSVELVDDNSCNAPAADLDLNDVKRNCNHHCDACNKTGSCSFKSSLEVPSSPSFLYSEVKAIALQWNNSKKASSLVSMYVLEVKSNVTSQGPLEILPFLSRYHFINVTNSTNPTNVTVKELQPQTKYKFRVAAFGPDGISNYSDWSVWFSTNSTCKRTTASVFIRFPRPHHKSVTFPCPMSQLKLNVSLKIRDRKPVVLDATLSFKFPPDIRELKDSFSILITVKLLKHEDPSVHDLCENYHNDDFKKSYAVTDGKIPTSFDLSSVINPGSLKKSIHFGCKYEVKIVPHNSLVNVPANSFETTSVFRIPECLQGVYSCPLTNPSIHVNSDDLKSPNIHINIIEESINGNYTARILWNIEAWDNLLKVEFFHFTVVEWPTTGSGYYYTNDVNAVDGVSEYHSAASNMSEGKSYQVVVRAYHGKNCIHERIERETFKISKPCKGGCNVNATCLPRNTFDGSAKCKCNEGFSGNGTFCSVITKPCEGRCNPNATCLPRNTFDGSAQCECNEGFSGNGTFCAVIGLPVPRASKHTDKEINVAAIVVPVILIIALVLCVAMFLLKRRQKRKRMAHELFIEMQTSNIPHSSSNSNLYRHFPSTRRRSDDDFPEKNVEPLEDREVNLIYVPQEIQYAISRGLTDGYEFNAELLKLGKCLGKGAFGNVYYAEAQAISADPGSTPVAVKTLSEHTSERHVDDFIEEIQLMKKLGDHEHVVKMLGCCTLTLPICLIMEYAPHGNLLDYLRNLRSKLEGNIPTTPLSEDDDPKRKSTAQQFEKSGSDTNYAKKLDPDVERSPAKEPIDDFHDIDGVIESSELESFALQIAKGMAYVAGRGIVHRDLAARNILIGHDRVLKISDFGLSKEGVYVKTTRGKIPLRWLSVEAIRERLYSTASDVWAFGIILWEICTLGGFPYPSISDRDLQRFLEKGKRLEKPSNCTDEIYAIMIDCWSYMPDDRPSFGRLRDMLWKLKYNENPYVNIDPLQDFPPVNEGSSEHDFEGGVTADDVISTDPETKEESVSQQSEKPGDDVQDKESSTGTPNPVFPLFDETINPENFNDSDPDDDQLGGNIPTEMV